MIRQRSLLADTRGIGGLGHAQKQHVYGGNHNGVHCRYDSGKDGSFLSYSELNLTFEVNERSDSETIKTDPPRHLRVEK
jgi:hypothetical protein